jgi:hypothetical protein
VMAVPLTSSWLIGRSLLRLSVAAGVVGGANYWYQRKAAAAHTHARLLLAAPTTRQPTLPGPHGAHQTLSMSLQNSLAIALGQRDSGVASGPVLVVGPSNTGKV